MKTKKIDFDINLFLYHKIARLAIEKNQTVAEWLANFFAAEVSTPNPCIFLGINAEILEVSTPNER